MTYATFNTKLNRLGPVNDNSPTIWTYVTTDSQTTVATSGYFNAVANKLKVGDLIYVTTAASPWSGGLAIVKSNTRNITAATPVAGVVDLFNFTTINTSLNSF